jgi:hypothetical protein
VPAEAEHEWRQEEPGGGPIGGGAEGPAREAGGGPLGIGIGGAGPALLAGQSSGCADTRDEEGTCCNSPRLVSATRSLSLPVDLCGRRCSSISRLPSVVPCDHMDFSGSYPGS